MRLIYKIAIRLSLVIVPLLALWSGIFYFAMVNEINDEIDDALEDYSENIITRALAGERLPRKKDGSNNSYQIVRISKEYAAANRHIKYYDANVYIEEKREKEPARVLTTIFKDRKEIWYELTVSTPSFEREDLLRTVLYWILFIYLLILVSGVSVTMWVFQKSLSPLYSLLKWLDDYIPGHKVSPVPNNTDITELKRLNVAVEEATNRSEQIYALQKQFIGNASHELQTPLAVLGNRMERMLNSANLTEEQMEEVMSMLQTQRHIVRLNKDLLLLTKIDNCQFTESENVDIVQLVRQHQAVYEEIFEGKGIECNMNLYGTCIVSMNTSLADVLVTNLLRNAYIHSHSGSHIEVELCDSLLSVSNSGDYPLDSNKIFERFYQGVKKEGSTGLGLSIVKAICNLYNLQISYSFEEKKHKFSVKFF